MSEGEVLMEFPLDGEPKITVKGVKGAACKTLSDPIEKALGLVTSDKPTAEMREVPQREHRRVTNR